MNNGSERDALQPYLPIVSTERPNPLRFHPFIFSAPCNPFIFANQPDMRPSSTLLIRWDVLIDSYIIHQLDLTEQRDLQNYL